MVGHYNSCPDPHDCWCKVRRYSLVLAVVGIVVAVQVSTGLYFEIISLVADGGHSTTHSAAYFVALVAAVLIKFGSDHRKTDRRASYIIIGLLFLTAFWIVFEAADRLFNNQKEIVGWIMSLGGLFGFIGNHIEHRILKNAPDEHKDHAHEGMMFHVVTDRALSALVCVGGIINEFTGSTFIDPAVSLVISCWIFWGAIKLARKTYTDGK